MSRTPLLTATSLVAAALVLSACKPQTPAPAPAAAPTPAAAPAAPEHAFTPALNAEDFAAHVQRLASDEFEGRAPGSAGEEKTVDYLQTQFKRIGLQPGNGDSYFQDVPMVQTTADPATVLKLEVNGQPRELKFGTDMVVGTRTAQPDVKLDASDLVFVGYGVNAPELKWNDYAGVDVKGKTVVMFVNDPGFHSHDEKLFEGKRMTYYGRWTYKFEEAARQGAAAALIIHDTDGAAYGWEVVRNGWVGPQFDLRASDDPEPRVPVQGWITGDVARQLMKDLGQNLDALYAAAAKPGFKAMPLKAKASVTLKSTIEEKSSRNVVAKLPGAKRPDEAIVYMAHWDHLGNKAHEGHDGAPASGDDTIYNGAIDNASGVAGILEIAEAFSKQTPAPDRSVVFLAVTLEESGLLGSNYYVAHPSVPLANTVGVINLDAMPVIGKARDMTVIGKGNSQLEDLLKKFTDSQGRVLTAEATPQDGFYFRSDHFNFAKAGVPALDTDDGLEYIGKPPEFGKQKKDEYTKNDYHSPSEIGRAHV